MKVISNVQRVKWSNAGELAAPEDFNAILLYGQDCLDDVAQKRFAKGLLPLSYTETADSPYTQAMNVEERTYRFICPVTCVIERAFFNANMTSTAEVVVNITDTGAATPQGVTVPWLSTKDAVLASGAVVAASGIIADETVDIQSLNVDRFLIVAGTEYLIIVSSTGNFTLNRFDLILHVLTDRWQPAAVPVVPSVVPNQIVDGSGASAAAVNANNTTLANAAALFATHLTAPVPTSLVKHNFVLGTSVNLRKFRLPSFAPGRAQSQIVFVALFAFTAGATTIQAIVRDSAGTVKATISAVVAGTQMTATSGIISIPLNVAASDASDPTKDFTVEFTNSSAVNCIKASCLVWISR